MDEIYARGNGIIVDDSEVELLLVFYFVLFKSAISSTHSSVNHSDHPVYHIKSQNLKSFTYLT